MAEVAVEQLLGLYQEGTLEVVMEPLLLWVPSRAVLIQGVEAVVGVVIILRQHRGLQAVQVMFF